MKTRMIGYAVCHQIASHSFAIGGQPLPLCARCTGTFVGALVGFFGQAVVLRRRRMGEFPPVPLIVVLIGFIVLMGLDGLNSYLTFFPGIPHLYEPKNWLRLATGALNGLALSVLLFPAFNSTLWRNHLDGRAVRNLRDLSVLLALEIGLVGLVLTRSALLLYPLALLSAAGVLALLTGVNCMLVLIITNRDNRAETWRDTVTPLLVGLTLSLIEVAAIDIARFALTGTLGGIPLLQ